MKLTGLYKRIKGLDEAPKPTPPGGEGVSGASAGGLSAAEDLELEKRWLQLARVDVDEFRRFYDKYYDHVFRYLELRTGNRDTAQDLTQDVFLYAVRHLDRFTWQGRSFGVWLFHIARRRALPRYWRSGRRRSEEVFLRERSSGATAASQASELERAELLVRVRGLIARFGDDRHDAFVLHVFMEYPLRETALAMDVPVETVRSHLRRGRLQLAEWLRDESALNETERRRVSELLAGQRNLTMVPQPRKQRGRKTEEAETITDAHRPDGNDGHEA